MMRSTWQLQEAKGNFSQLVKQAAAGEAQVVTVHGKPTAVVVSAQQHAQLTRRKGRLSSALLQPDLAIDDLDLARSRDTGRDPQPTRRCARQGSPRRQTASGPV